MDIIWWLLNYWPFIIYFIVIGVIYLLRGWKTALMAATLGGGFLLYRQGKKDGRSEFIERNEQVEQERQDAYKEIDGRNTTRDDVIDRLHDNSW